MYDHPVFDLAKEEWGTTSNPYAAGYILPDGSMLDMSEGQGERVLDHRSVEQFFDKDYAERWQPMIRFMEEGAIRMSGHRRENALFLDYVRRPTDAQDSTIREITRMFEEVTVERTNPDTGTVEIWNEWGVPGKARLHPAAVIRWMDETGLKGLGKVKAPHLTDTIFYRTCKEIGQDYQAYEPYDSAFILPDGCFVKLDSHENIASYYPDEIMDTFQREYQAVEDYVERGAIRTHWDGDLNAISFEFHKKPTATQQRIVREMSSWADQVYIDAKQEGPRKGIIAFDVIPILSKRDAGQVVRFMNEKGFGQALGPAGGSCGAGITWQRVTDSIGELRRLYTGFPLPGKPKVKKKCAWALEAALGKFDEALSYRARGECGQAQEHTLDAIRYHGVFLGCQSEKEKKRKKRKKKR